MESSSKTENKSLMVTALEYAAMGFYVLPLHTTLDNRSCSCARTGCSSPAKHPRTMNGVKDATLDPIVICEWWSTWPNANIGIATGSESKIIVVDIDPRHGGADSWASISKGLPPTLSTKTGGGGNHFIFCTSGTSISNKTSILPGIDIRGQGGYIVAPPSVHFSGKPYEWLDKPSRGLINNLPEVIKDLIFRSRSNVIPMKAQQIPSGSRNNTLASVAGSLRKQGLDQAAISKALESLNLTLCMPPLNNTEVIAIARSISKYPVANDTRVAEWSAKKQLPELKIELPTLTEDYLPMSLRPWLKDIAERMHIPLEFVAAPTIISLSSVIGRQVGIYPKQKDDWLVVPNLWGAVIARPGFFKSPAIAEAMKPLEYLVEKSRTKFESQQTVAKAREEVLKSTIDGLKENIKKSARKGNEHELDDLQLKLEASLKALNDLKVFEKRYKTNDATIEKIGALLVENPNGMMILRDELSGWLKSLNKSGREGDREFYLEAWNGYGSYTVDRIGRGTLHIPSLCLSVFGGLQPGKLDAYVSQSLKGGVGDDGLLQRFQILVFPETPKKWKNVDRKPNLTALESVHQIYAKLSDLNLQMLQPEIGKGAVPGLRFDEPAQEVFNTWRERLEIALRSSETSSPAYESHLAKYRSLVPTLALIFHLVDFDYSGSASPSRITSPAITLAIRWATFLESHARKVYSNALHPELKAAHALATKISSGLVKDKDSVRSIYRRCWSLLDTAQAVDSALSVLEDYGWVRVESPRNGHSSAEIVRINPKLIHENINFDV